LVEAAGRVEACATLFDEHVVEHEAFVSVAEAISSSSRLSETTLRRPATSRLLTSLSRKLMKGLLYLQHNPLGSSVHAAIVAPEAISSFGQSA
jgi:hypothetical protein